MFVLGGDEGSIACSSVSLLAQLLRGGIWPQYIPLRSYYYTEYIYCRSLARLGARGKENYYDYPQRSGRLQVTPVLGVLISLSI